MKRYVGMGTPDYSTPKKPTLTSALDKAANRLLLTEIFRGLWVTGVSPPYPLNRRSLLLPFLIRLILIIDSILQKEGNNQLPIREGTHQSTFPWRTRSTSIPNRSLLHHAPLYKPTQHHATHSAHAPRTTQHLHTQHPRTQTHIIYRRRKVHCLQAV